MDSCTYQWDIVKKLSFNRPAGTDADRKAGDMIIAEIERLGGKAETETFSFDAYTIDKAVFSVVEPYEKNYEVTGIGMSGEIEGEFDFRYVERATEFDMEGVDGGMVLINKLEGDQYKGVINSPAECFVTVGGKFYETAETADLGQIRLRKWLLDIGQKPGFLIRSRDAVEMVQNGASRVRCELKQHETKPETRNIYSIIEGRELPDEYITFSAHYDSVSTGVGAFDNATGVAALFDLYRYFMENKPRRSMIFLWCGAEELGLLGSRKFTLDHKDWMEKAKMEVNFDLTGPTIGYNGVSIMGDESVCEYVRNLAKEKKHSFVVNRGVASSDCNCFAAVGIPSFNFYRYGEAELHNRHDVLFPLSAKTLGPTVGFVREFVLSCDEAEEWPIDTKMPEDLAKELEKAFK